MGCCNSKYKSYRDIPLPNHLLTIKIKKDKIKISRRLKLNFKNNTNDCDNIIIEHIIIKIKEPTINNNYYNDIEYNM